MRQGSSVSIAEHQSLGPALNRLIQGRQGILLIVLEAVEKVLGVVDHLVDPAFKILEGVLNDFKVLVKGNFQGVGDVHIPALAEDGNDRCLRLKHGLDVGILVDAVVDPAGGAERGDPRMAKLYPADFFEVLDRHRVRAGPTALDIVDAELIECVGDTYLVVDREVEILGLGTVS